MAERKPSLASGAAADALIVSDFIVDLPTDRRPKKLARHSIDRVTLTLSGVLTRSLQELARKQDSSLLATLGTAWAVLLWRWSQQEQFVIGVASGESRTTVLVRLHGAAAIEQLLADLDAALLRAGIDRQQHSVALTTHTELSARFTAAPPGLQCEIEYASELFDRQTIERLGGRLQTLLAAIAQDVRQPIDRVAVLDASERHLVLHTFNDTVAAYPEGRLIHELFQQQAERTPDAIAIAHGRHCLTYRELNTRANCLAHYLIGRGVGPDRLVGIYMDRNSDLFVALLGVLKAGGAYVPLDPKYPAERLRGMLQDATPWTLLTQRTLRAALPSENVSVVTIDEEWAEISRCDDVNPDARAQQLTARHLAYVIYTSGSTGTPKGVMIEHAAVVNFLASMQRQPGIAAADRMLALTTVSFDMSVTELYLPLVSGAQIVLADREATVDAHLLMRVLEEFDVTVLQATPATWQLLLMAGWPGRSGLKALCGGETMSSDLAAKLIPRVRSLWNMYGPTETAVWSCVQRVLQPDGHDSVEPVGRPIANTQVYILDPHRQPVPVGAVGEIYIGGAGVARGYLKRRELTAERFVPHAFSDNRQARLYKTGDLGRWRADGSIEYLGRNDHQVKIRGFRIELGEIEAQLLRHSGVNEAAVVAREDLPGEKRLVAYVTASAIAVAPGVEELRAHVRAALPEYMVPSAVVTLERMPLTPNGKLDRRALPVPQLDALAARPYEPPQGDMEELLARLWQSLLRVPRVGRADNFFELGGHSLLIAQMSERLRQAGLSIDVARALQSATLAELAKAIGKDTSAAATVPSNGIPPQCASITPQMLPLVNLDSEQIQSIVDSVPGGAANIQDIYPLAPCQEGLLFHHLLDEQGTETYLINTVLSVPTPEAVQALIEGLGVAVARHDALRTAVLWEHLPKPVQVVYRQATLPVDRLVLDPLRDPVQQLEECTQGECEVMDVRRAPLLRLKIAVCDPPHRQYVVLQTHHLACDDESLHAVLAEAMAHVEGHPPPLAQSVPYRIHVAQTLIGADTETDEKFFRGKLSGVGEPTAPFGLLETFNGAGHVGHAQSALDSDVSSRLHAQARRLGVSTAALFHAAYGLVLACVSAREDVVFGTILLGRLQGYAGVQCMVGMLANTLPVRVQLQGATVQAAVEQTHRELIELLGHEQASLAVAQRCSGVAVGTPLFGALLNYVHVSSLSSRQIGRGIQLLFSRNRTSYPVTFSVQDDGTGFVLAAQTAPQIDAQRLLACMQTAIHSIVEALELRRSSPLLDLRVLPVSEQRVLDTFNPAVKYPQEQLIHELFEQRSRSTPNAVAVTYEGTSLTYAQLNERANQLAWHLIERGVGPDQLVGICLERSLEMLVALLATLKSGGAYVPLDPNYPSERLTYMLHDAAPIALLTQESLLSRVGDACAVTVSLDGDSSEIGRQPTHDADARSRGLRAHHMAYVIYTSGSTGNPKGVMVEHRNVTRLFAATQQRFGFNEQDVWTLFHSVAFDFSVWEIWGALLHGGRVVVVPYAIARSPKEFYRLLCSERVTVLNQTPSAFAQLIDAQAHDPDGQHSLRFVIFGGEALEPHLLQPWVDRNGDACPQLINMYGITETTVHVTYRPPLTRQQIATERGSFIGRPLDDLRVYLLNPRQQAVPIGVVAELYVGGAGVARGYLNRSALTAERFLRDPFSPEPSARMYRTGDLGRWCADGTLEYLGRNDLQIKIRGFRIELGEIESHVRRQPQVKDVVVIAREDVPGEKRLVAYVIAKEAPDGAGLRIDALRADLKAQLPEHMLPGAVVVLDRFPLTVNGKLDRRALPAPDFDAYASRVYEEPLDPVEEALAEIWQQVLALERVGRHDSFFELGGHSLLAMQVAGRIQARLSVDVPIRLLFEQPTLMELAAHIAELRHECPVDARENCDDIDELLEQVNSMSEMQVRAMLNELNRGRL